MFYVLQVTIEIPYVFLQAALFSTITYPTINFHWSVFKVCWYFCATFCTFLYFNYLGLLVASLTPTFEVASVMAALCYTMLNLFAGFLIPGPVSQLLTLHSYHGWNSHAYLACLINFIHEVS